MKISEAVGSGSKHSVTTPCWMMRGLGDDHTVSTYLAWVIWKARTIVNGFVVLEDQGERAIEQMIGVSRQQQARCRAVLRARGILKTETGAGRRCRLLISQAALAELAAAGDTKVVPSGGVNSMPPKARFRGSNVE